MCKSSQFFSKLSHLITILHFFHTYQLMHLHHYLICGGGCPFSIKSSTSLLLFWLSWFSVHGFTFAWTRLVFFVDGFPSLFYIQHQNSLIAQSKFLPNYPLTVIWILKITSGFGFFFFKNQITLNETSKNWRFSWSDQQRTNSFTRGNLTRTWIF